MAGYKFTREDYHGEDIKSTELIAWLNDIPERYRDEMREGEYEVFLAIKHHLINKINDLAGKFHKRLIEC